MGMTATERLRRLLDERGVEHFESPNGIAWGERSSPTYGFRHRHYAVELDGLLCLSSHRITPEQAIAATLGGGKLTAEQVRAAIFNGSGYASFDGVKYYADGIGMQAIADELNATLGRKTCRIVEERASDQLKDENDHLREMSKFNYESSEFYRDRAHRLLVERDNLKAENAKLRELARLAYDCATSGVRCRDCALLFGDGSCQLKTQLENMGIEVVE